jgi:DNA-binding transcriptional regulator LsrR (DeoR family)
VLELVRRVARAGGGTAHVYYAPLVAADAATARTLRRQPDVARAAALLPTVTVGAVGIGAWAPGLSTVFDAIEPDTQQRTARLGVVAEVSGVPIDAQGRPVNAPLAKRIIGVTGDDLAGMRTVLAVAYGDEKAEAVRAALHGGLVSGLITHASLARQLLYAVQTADD